MQEFNQNTGGKKRLYVALLTVFLLIFLGCTGVLIHKFLVRKSAADLYEQLVENSTVTTEDTLSTEEQSDEETEEDTKEEYTVPAKELDWDALQEQNADIYAWIYIPGTQVDYPVLQDSESLDYYLYYNLDGSKGYPGCIYSQYVNSKEFRDPNTILYGHNMKDGTMFHSLHNYEDEDFFNENPYIYIYTPDTNYVYKIFAVCTVGDEHLMSAYDFWDAVGFNSFVSDVRSAREMTSHVREDMEVTYGDYLITLSTCISGQSDKRWLVIGKLEGSTNEQ